MRKLLLSTAAIAATVAFASPASAAICIGVSTGGGPITNVGCDTATPGSVNYNTTTGGYNYNVGGQGSPLLAMPTLLTQSINIRTLLDSPSTVDVYLTQTGLTSFGGSLLSTFTSNTILGSTAEVTSYYSLANLLFAGTQLQDTTFSGPGTFNGSNPLSNPGPWSETIRYHLTFTGGVGSNFNGTANLTAVPEPATWGMMLLGFLGVGMVMRRRRNPALAQLA